MTGSVTYGETLRQAQSDADETLDTATKKLC